MEYHKVEMQLNVSVDQADATFELVCGRTEGTDTWANQGFALANMTIPLTS